MDKSEITVLVDMDDTIENLCDAWVNYLNKEHNLSVSPSDIVHWDMCKAFPSLSKTQVYKPLHDPNMWKSVTPKKDAQIYLKRLIDDGYSVYLCTSTNYDVTTPKMTYILNRYFPYIDWKKLITAHDKFMVRGDIIIDDGPHNFDSSRRLCILYDTPHNQEFDDCASSNTVRAHGWEDVYNIVGRYYDKWSNFQ